MGNKGGLAIFVAISALVLTFGMEVQASDLGTDFTYQGQLKQNGSAFTGSADFVFLLFDASTGGGVQGLPVNVNAQTVTDGLFTVELDFGVDPYVANENRWLEISVRSPAGSGVFDTLTPRQKLTATPFSLATRGINVDGDGNISAGAGLALGNDAVIGVGGTVYPNEARVADLSQKITDFSLSDAWSPIKADVVLDPTVDLTGANATAIYSHDFTAYIPPTSDKDFYYVQGPYMSMFNYSSGEIEVAAGAFSSAWSSDNADVIYQAGFGCASQASSSANIDFNVGLEVSSGHAGIGTGDIDNDYSIYVYSPDHNSPLGNHYGLYFEDQDFGDNDSYAIYAAGGDMYMNGNLTATGQCAFGNLATFDLGGPYYPETERNFEFADRITDFSNAKYWSMFSAYLVADPDVDLNNGEYVEGITGGTIIPAESDGDIFYTSGATFGSELHGAGDFKYVWGTNGYTYVLGSANVEYLTSLGATTAILPGSTSSVDNLSGLDVILGQNSPTATVETSTGIRVYTPYYLGPVTTHYGILLEDQNSVATNEYAIYSAGGDVYLNGDLEVTGNISKGGGSFKIDHPLDPENKYLYHSFVESPDMMNVYNGNITTDDEGFATVAMPDWFEALNRDFRYQLTVIGQFAQAIVAEKMADNRFVIRTDKPSVEVSWQVTGIRQDAFANENRIPLEVDKAESERGQYLHPTAFGQPEDRRVGHRESPQAPEERIRSRMGASTRTDGHCIKASEMTRAPHDPEENSMKRLPLRRPTQVD